MTKITAASYLPDSMVITLKPQFDALANPNDIRGFEGPEQIGFIFHEWIHYFHNVSTLHGLTAFMNVVGLWTSFRHSGKDCKFSGGSAILSPELALNIEQRISYWRAARLPKKTSFPDLPLEELALNFFEEFQEPIAGTELKVTTLRFRIGNKNQPEEEHVIEIGTHEIIEGVAWMLEDKLVSALGGLCRVPSLFPYQLVRNIFRLRAASISDDAIIACMLRSLQDSDPPAALFDCLEAVPEIIDMGLDVVDEMAKLTIRTMQENTSWRTNVLTEVDKIFPINEPMGRLVKHTTALMRKNLDARTEAPFLEFHIIERLKERVGYMDEVIKTYGACSIIQLRPGSLEIFTRDLIYDLVAPSEADPDLEFGRRQLHAAFHYLQLHIQDSVFISTDQVNTSAGRARCPFYTACNLTQREQFGEVCRDKPWELAKSNDKSLFNCWYRAGVIATTG